MLEKKDYVSVSKGAHNLKVSNLQRLYNLQEFYTAFREKHSNVNIGLSKLCVLMPKWYVLAGSKMTHSVCVWSVHQDIVLLVDAMDWELI